MQKLILLPGLIILGILFTACDNSKIKKEMSEAESEYKYIPLNELKYEAATIAEGAEVEILANLGGKKNSGDTVYYYQFIVRNKISGDTIRILCPEITIDESAGIDNKTSTTPLLFNPEKGINTAFFEPIDSTKSLLLNGENMKGLTESNDSIDINHLLDPANTINMVVLDKNDSPERVFRFKTAVGVLNFKKIPW